MDGSMANQQGALPDPKAACQCCHPAMEDSVDLEFKILDVESEILDVATALAAKARLATSMCAYLLPPERLAALSPANRLKLLRKHLSRFQNRLHRILHRPQGRMKRIKCCEKIRGSRQG